MRITILDRSTVLHSIGFDFQKKPKLLIHFLLGLMFASDTRLGYDPTIQINSKLERIVKLGNYTCILTKLCWKNSMIRGCVTTVYYVKVNKEEMVLKLSWSITTQSPSEVYFLQMAKENKVKGVPELVTWGRCSAVQRQGHNG